MSERDFQPELDDELLSAYLDDELSAEERAAIETRLANDPEAQQLLHQLRSVSQSVQLLPTESVGRDLSGDILRRIELKNRGEGGSEGSGLAQIGAVTPRLPIFGSRRSWIWATLAVAAGLMIMILERGEEKRKQLPAVARKDIADATQLSHDRAESVRDQSKVPETSGSGAESKVAKMDAVGERHVAGAPSASPASPRAGADKLASSELTTGPTAGEVSAGDHETSDQIAASGRMRELRDSPTVVGGAAPQGATEASNGANDGKSAVAGVSAPKATPGFASTTGGSGASGGIAMSKRANSDTLAESSAATDESDGFVVVHVSAKPDAIRGGEFEKLLARNGVAFDEKDKTDEAVSSSDASRRPAPHFTKSEDTDRKKNVETDSIDVVVVDAPRDVVAACMADLQQDESNFASVEVEQPAATEKSEAAATNIAKQLGSELRQYNRGMTANKPALGTRNYSIDSAGQARSQLNEANQPAAGGASEQIDRRSQNQRAAQLNRGRALRVQVGQNEEQTLRDSQFGRRAGGFGGGGGGESDQSRRNVVQQQKPQNEDSDEVRVLFMLSPEVVAPAPSKKAAE